MQDVTTHGYNSFLSCTNRRNIGYDGNTKIIVNMIGKGIVDPSKVTRTALKNAASIASMILTTECVVVKIYL